MNQERFEKHKNFSKHLFGKTLLIALIFGLFGVHLGLSCILVLFHIATPATENFIIAKSLYEKMIHPGERGFAVLGGFIGRLGEIHDAVVFLPFLIILSFILFANYFHTRNREKKAGLPSLHPVKANLPLIYFALLIFLPSAILFYQVKEVKIALPLAMTAAISFLSAAVFFALIPLDLAEAFQRRPFWTTVAFLLAMALLSPIAGMFSEEWFAVHRPGSFMDYWYLAWPIHVFCTLMLFLLVGEGGVISFLAGRKLALGSSLKRGLLVAGLLLAALIPVHLYGRYFYETFGNFAIGEAGEPTRLGFRRLTAGLGMNFGIPLAVVGGALTAMIPRGVASRKRLLALIVPLLFILSVWGVGKSFANYCQKVWEMDKASLDEAASLIKQPKAPSPRMALLLKDAQKEKGTEVKFRDPLHYPSPKEVDLIPENLARLNEYLKTLEGKWTAFTDQAMYARQMIASRYWLVEDFRDILLDNSLKRGSILNSMLLLNSLIHSPTTARNIRILDDLSDEGKFIVKGKACLRMAGAWAAMGEPEKAKKFYQCAQKSLAEKELEGFTISEKPAFIQGKLTGRIRGEVTKRGRLGIFYLREEKDFGAGRTSLGPARIKAAMDLGEDGSFLFDNLPEGRYYLGLLLREDVQGPFDIRGGGIFSVGWDNPTVKTGEIRVTQSSSVESPDKK